MLTVLGRTEVSHSLTTKPALQLLQQRASRIDDSTLRWHYLNNNRWNATVTILVHDANENPVVGAVVSGLWSGEATGSGTCITDAAGQCTITLTNIKSNVSSVTFTVTDVALGSAVYQPVYNHDPEGDSDGSTITLIKP